MSIRWVTSLLGLLLTVTIMVTAGLSWNVYSSFTKMVEADVQYLNLDASQPGIAPEFL